jgi:hypothetical protein
MPACFKIAQRALGQIAGVVGDGGVAVGRGVAPNLVAAGRLTVELKAQRL